MPYGTDNFAQGITIPWACPKCGMGYGDANGTEGFYTCGALFANMVPKPQPIADCADRSQFMCQKGYYAQDTRCLACSGASPICSYGYYYERCQRSATGACLACANFLPNATSQRYGPQAPVPECPNNVYDGTCALFLTPSWDSYACLIYCNVGYTNVQSSTLAPVPDCRPCEEVCGLGYYCPDVTAQFHACVACDALDARQKLPANAQWLSDCQWRCRDGYYKAVDGTSCAACPTDQLCLQGDSFQFMGCMGDSPGKCTPADARACVAGVSFLHFEVYWASPVCQPCAVATPHVTYQTAACTQHYNTQLAPCTTTGCPKGKYQVAPCTLTSDIQCWACTVGQPGQLMASYCGATYDARFVQCPEGSACDGSMWVLTCAPPLIALKGVCVCPPATQLVQGRCTPIPCDLQGWYPNATLDGCSPCPGGDAQVRTLPGVMGLSACGCAAGYFMEWTPDGLLRCWPCGDMVCTAGLQLQSPCPGDSALEPDCLCSVPPGARVLDPDRCTFECGEGMERTAGANMQPGGLWGGSAWAGLLPAGLAQAQAVDGVQGLALIGPDMLVLHNGSQLAVEYQNAVYWVDNGMLIQGNRRMLVEGSMRVCQDARLNRFWVGFTYAPLVSNTGTVICGLAEYPEQQTCTTVELVEVGVGNCGCSFWQDCAPVPLCITPLYTGVWGNTMQAGFVEGPIRDMAMDLGASVLYMLLGSGWVVRYEVHYYTPSTTDRLPDPIVNVSQLGPTVPASIAVVGSTLFMPGRSLGGSRYAPPADAEGLYAIGDHVLGSTGGLQADIWNGVTAASAVQGRVVGFAYGRWAIFNGTHLVQRAGMSCAQDLMLVLENCVPMQCVRVADACGLHTARAQGSSTCGCIPGFFAGDAGGCVPCTANSYCTGGRAISCGPNAISPPGASEVAQCSCQSGYYPFQQGGLCLGCPIGFWCLGGRTLPIPCMDRATTLTQGSNTPLDCYCMERTKGITCLLCDASELCLPMPTRPLWEALKLVGWSTGVLHIADCVPQEEGSVYVIPGPPIQDPSQFYYSWGWVVTMKVGTVGNLSGCMLAQGLYSTEPSSVFSPKQQAYGVMYSSPCALNSEWPGVGLTCMCIAGYATRSSSGVCLPCPNGTIRASRSPDACVPCSANNTHAPWLGMSHCVCLPGFYLDVQSDECLQVQSGFYLYEWLSSPLTAIALTIASGVLCILGSLAAALLSY